MERRRERRIDGEREIKGEGERESGRGRYRERERKKEMKRGREREKLRDGRERVGGEHQERADPGRKSKDE